MKQRSMVAVAIVCLILAHILLCIQGCAGVAGLVQAPLAEQLDEQAAQTEALRETARKIVKDVGFNQGLIYGSMGGEAAVQALYPDVHAAMFELKKLYDKSLTPEGLSDEELGMVLGLHFRQWVKTLQSAIRQFAPNLVGQLSSLFML